MPDEIPRGLGHTISQERRLRTNTARTGYSTVRYPRLRIEFREYRADVEFRPCVRRCERIPDAQRRRRRDAGVLDRVEITVKVPSGSDRVATLGSADRNLKMIREALGVSITARDGSVRVKGDRSSVATARRVLCRLTAGVEAGRGMTRAEVLNIIADESSTQESKPPMPDEDEESGDVGTSPPKSIGWDTEDSTSRRSRHGTPAARGVHESDDSGGRGHAHVAPARRDWDGSLDVFVRGRRIRPQTVNQDRYLQAIRDHDLVFAIGPAGTGKTYLAVAAAVHLLKTDRCVKVILCRPAVEAGEKLGFLPGDLEAKVNPYLRPLLDALHDMLEYATLRRFMESDVVEICPLAFMRGRTLNNAVIILDEAQNTTRGQMKMFLTRMGHGSKMVITGDTTQIDLPDPRQSGLIDAARRLTRTAGVGFTQLDRADVVRHPIVQRVIDAYGEDDAKTHAAWSDLARDFRPDDAPYRTSGRPTPGEDR
jgi:phosphate starvation-inducible protein PhoH and related proteins